jgi:uncharacterized membrane protein
VPVPIGVAVAVTAALLYSPAVGLLLGWDTVAVVYIGWLAFVLPGRDAEQTARRATTTDPDRVATDVALLSAAVASLVTVAFVLIRAPHGGSTLEFIQVGFGVVSVVVSWAALRRTVLRHALLSYLFGTGILATTVTLVANLRSA